VAEVVCLELDFVALGSFAVRNAHDLERTISLLGDSSQEESGRTPALLIKTWSFDSLLLLTSASEHELGRRCEPEEFLRAALDTFEIGQIARQKMNVCTGLVRCQELDCGLDFVSRTRCHVHLGSMAS